MVNKGDSRGQAFPTSLGIYPTFAKSYNKYYNIFKPILQLNALYLACIEG